MNTDEINVYDKYSSGKIEISISQTNILSITFVNMDLTVKIIYVDNGLIMTTTYANSKWINMPLSSNTISLRQKCVLKVSKHVEI
jgi:hypothetical protein